MLHSEWAVCKLSVSLPSLLVCSYTELSLFLLLTLQQATLRLLLFTFTWSEVGLEQRAYHWKEFVFLLLHWLCSLLSPPICCIKSAPHTVEFQFLKYISIPVYFKACRTKYTKPLKSVCGGLQQKCFDIVILTTQTELVYNGQSEFCDDFITIGSSKQNQLLRLVSEDLSDMSFFLFWQSIDMNLMMFVMKSKSQTNYIKELWSPVPCLSEHVMIGKRLEQPPTLIPRCGVAAAVAISWLACAVYLCGLVQCLSGLCMAAWWVCVDTDHRVVGKQKLCFFPPCNSGGNSLKSASYLIKQWTKL